MYSIGQAGPFGEINTPRLFKMNTPSVKPSQAERSHQLHRLWSWREEDDLVSLPSDSIVNLFGSVENFRIIARC